MIQRASQGTDGAPRIPAELAAAGTPCGRTRVARLMRRAGLVGCQRRRAFTTTQRDPAAPAAPDLVQRAGAAAAPERRWVADIADVPRGAGFLDLAGVLDAFSRRGVGWSRAEPMRAAVAVAAWRMALGRRQPPAGLIHHADHGRQSTAAAFTACCHAAAIRRSMGSLGDCFDNALAESCFATWEGALLTVQTFRPTSRRARRSAPTSRASAIAAGAMRRWATSRRTPTRGGTRNNKRLPRAP